MSFIGNVPAEAYSPVVKDTFSGNGSTTDFTLSIPATTNSVEVFVENVQQEPTTAYTISGTTLSFTAAPVTGTNNIYVIHRGPAVQQVVPPAGVALNPSTVTATGDISTEGDLKVEVASGGIYTITGTDTSSNRTLTLPDEAGTVLTSGSNTVLPKGVPTFSAAQNASQSVSLTTFTKLQFNVEEWDTASCYDHVTNYRFTPNVAGFYQVNARTQFSTDTAFSPEVFISIYKNGAEYKRLPSSSGYPANSIPSPGGAVIVFLNGSTDFIEAYVYRGGGVSTLPINSSTSLNYFQAFLVRAT